MKRIITLLVMVGMFTPMLITTVYSSPDSGIINVTATLQAGTPDATFVLYKAPFGGDIDFSAKFTSMNFDRWTIVQKTGKPAQWTSVDHYAVLAFTNGMGRQYFIKSVATGTFSNGITTLPGGSFACIPVYSPNDLFVPTDPNSAQGTMPAGATLASMFAAINAAPQTVYASENPGSSRIIQVRYAFPPYKDDGTAPYIAYAAIPSSQASGTYSGVTVKVSITQ